MMNIKPNSKVWVSPNPITDDYSLYGDATALRRSADGMVQVRFEVTTWVHEDHIEVR